MERVLESIDYKNIFKYFEEISRIPRGSGNNKKISDYLCKFAAMHNLKYVQDEALNVIIYKDAKILLEPLFNYKDHGEASSKENLIFDEEIKEHLISLVPRLNKDIDIKLYFSEGKLIENKNK